jgi:UPF0271 protein
VRSIDLNSDLGEGMPSDAEIMRYVTSANVACGGHAGDSETMRRTILLAQERGVSVGAHPGYPDRDNFGRRALDLPAEVLGAALRAQLGALAAIAETVGARLRHVKAHGALYNRGERDPAISDILASAVAEFDPKLLLVCPPGSAMAASAASYRLRIAREGFCDRAYEADGTLRSRALPGALLTDPVEAADQAVRLASRGEYDTLCVHGDTPGAPRIAAEVRRALAAAGIRVAPVEIAATR